MRIFIPTLLAAALLGACTATEPELDIAALHDRTLTLDTHIDIPLTYMTEIDPSGMTDLQVDLPKLGEGRLDSGFWIIYTPQGELNAAGYAAGREIAQTRLAALSSLTTTLGDDFQLATTSDQVRAIVSANKHAVLIGMENAYPLGESLDALSAYADAGVRYVGITHFGHNQFGDSSNPNPDRDSGPKWNGLSPLGRELVGALNTLGIMVDVSHAGKATMMQAADLSRTPIIASHSGAMAVADSARNLDDEQFRKIAEVGGVAQMVALDVYVKPLTPEQEIFRTSVRESFNMQTSELRAAADEDQLAAYEAEMIKIYDIEPRATVADFVDHIDHAVKVAGIDHVGIASDFDGGGGITGWEDASETENVTAELVKRGYSEADIAKIWGGNLLRVLDAVEAGKG